MLNLSIRKNKFFGIAALCRNFSKIPYPTPKFPLGIVIVIACLNAVPAFSQSLTKEEKKILKMDIRELLQMDVVVTSVSKKPEKINDTAAAVFVVTQEDIKRTGAVNIMEALRIVPGVQVSKINQNRYAVSIRGFNRRLGSDKLLVLMDGRTLYSPSAAGVFWLGQDTFMEDIDRIEVIRGPGAALWGSNAVAGVINIITKSSETTQGTLISGGIGNEENGFGGFRYGGNISQGQNFRFYGKYRNRDSGELLNGSEGIDNKELAQGGFRTDLKVDERKNLTLQGDYYNVDAGLDFPSRFISLPSGSGPFTGVTTQKGGNFIARWDQQLSNTSSYKLQTYFDHMERESGVPFNNVVDQFDIEFQHNFKWKERQSLSWGLNYRLANFNFQKTNIIDFSNEKTDLFGVFIHDEITIIPDSLKVILGSKFEHNKFTGWEIQPNIRTLLKLNNNHSLWAAFSRAVRIPTIREQKAEVNRALIPAGGTLTFPLLLKEVNNVQLNPEKLLAFEVGYRFNHNSTFYLDITGYHFLYEDIIEFTQGNTSFSSTPSPPHLILPFTNDNSLDGTVSGLEINGQWQLTPRFRLASSYSFSEINLNTTRANVFIPKTLNSEGDLDAEGEPNHIFSIRSYMDLFKNINFSTMLYFVSENTSRNIPSHERLDMNLTWKANENLELALIGQNLSNETHAELNELLERGTLTQRSYYFKATLNF